MRKLRNWDRHCRRWVYVDKNAIWRQLNFIIRSLKQPLWSSIGPTGLRFTSKNGRLRARRQSIPSPFCLLLSSFSLKTQPAIRRNPLKFAIYRYFPRCFHPRSVLAFFLIYVYWAERCLSSDAYILFFRLDESFFGWVGTTAMIVAYAGSTLFELLRFQRLLFIRLLA